MSDIPILRINALTKRFNDFTALHGINLNVRDGEFLAIVGPSGSGKTTLIRLLVGMDEPTEGSIWLRDRRIDEVPANKRPTCMVFQSLALFPHRTVGQNIEFPLKLRKVAPAKRKARALELLELLRLPPHYYDKRIDECSGGERQRVALARALAFDPEILFFDEPLSALDYRLRKTLEKELKDLHQRTGKTFIYITHSLEEAMVMSDRIAIMKAGHFEQIAAPTDIYARPRSRFVAEFMGEVNLFDMQDGQVPGLRFSPEAAGLYIGRTGTLMVRPESVTFLKPGEGADIAFDGVVEAEYLLGSRVQYTVPREGAAPVTVEVLRENAVGGPGTPVTMGCAASACHLIAEEEVPHAAA
ncbi:MULTISPECIES: ABC transporter ATP-binding protein [Salipiger]|uniref:Spermidine/putrescine transport system ATP-binding protein n=1 Tax=Salipiger profundus TaxID=1229727 RepID=A0A1U7D7R2_9RHOB|nr:MULTISPECIES: ABC transporter ATP-binding protein [Salipiger]APX24163.1 spermidine/putrescine transport system ATP-binding protein [Salipiger profundus]GFZ95064.1 Fe3+/spermidine/putrescine ABC transporter ATP-binding protein [Salipiger profundus]